MSTADATGSYRLLIVAAETIDGNQVREKVAERAQGRNAQIRLVAPAIDQSKFEHTMGDIDHAREVAEQRLEHSRSELQRAGLDAADAQIGDADLKQAIADSLAEFPADEILIVAHSDGGPSFERRWIEEAEHEFEQPITEVFVERTESGEERVADVERKPAGHTTEDQPFSARDMAGIVVAIVGTIVLVVLAASGSEDLTGLSSQSVRVMIAGALGLINIAHIVGLTLFQAGPYRGGWRDFFARLSLFGTPAAIVISALTLIID